MYKRQNKNWDDLINANLKSPLFLSQCLSEELKKRKGCIINIIDIHIDPPLKDHIIYNISKAGLLALTKSLAKELAPSIRVNGVSPGAIMWAVSDENKSTKKKEILGTDSKLFINQNDFKIDDRNKPRVFSNTSKISKNESIFKKSIFTLCDYRKEDKCPPWSLQASKMRHNKKNKTIYYDNAIIKVYDLPIFYLPKLSHPDPTVDRRTGFLPPSFSDSKNLGAGFDIPYFWALGKDLSLIHI